MYEKISSMQNILNRGLNIHKFHIPETYAEYTDILNELEFCTIRTDHATISKDLPFYIFNSAKDDSSKQNNIWNEAKTNSFKLIISDGVQYDHIQRYNMVVRLQRDGTFMFEASELKVPLRHMYKHPLLSCSSNIAEEISSWTVYNTRYGISKHEILKDIQRLYTYEIFDKWLEITKYPIAVGIRNERIVFWQIS